MLKEIFDKQSGLEERIKKEFALTGKDMIVGKLCSVIVEGAELLNELDAHKYWKRNKRKHLISAKGEAIDCLHFAIGLILNSEFSLEDILYRASKDAECYGYRGLEINSLKGLMKLSCDSFELGDIKADLGVNNNELMNTYLWMCEFAVRVLRKNRFKETKESRKGILKDLYKLLCSVLGMCHCLGMSYNDVYENYMDKNKVNIKRQDDKY